MHLRALLVGASLATISITSPASAALQDRDASHVGGNKNTLSPPPWKLLNTGSKARFRGLAPVSELVAWVSGTNGTVLRTEDGGLTFTSVGPSSSSSSPSPSEGEEETPVSELEFRDIQAWSATHAAILSIGSGSDSRIYYTRDGGTSWTKSFTNGEEAAFYDCFAFENANPKHGMAMSDPVDGRIRLIETWDAGASWHIIDNDGKGREMPPAKDGEFGFAASGTCIATASGRWYIATGGVNPGRVFRSGDGRNWAVSNSSIAGSESGGVFSVQFRDARHGIAVGGDFQDPAGNTDNAAYSVDGGKTWTQSEKFPGGYRSGSAWVAALGEGGCGLAGLKSMALAVGPTGSDFTADGGRTWGKFDNGSFDSVECVESKGGEKGKGKGRVCWASGQDGRVAKLSL
jgi:photosystem II stability/assembly factor-like uncharacterized protein